MTTMQGNVPAVVAKCEACGGDIYDCEYTLIYYGYRIHDDFSCKIEIVNKALGRCKN